MINNFRDFRYLIGFAMFAQSSGIFLALAINPKLAENQGFMLLATAVVVTGWIGGVVAFAFTAGIEASRQNKTISEAITLANNKIPPTEEGSNDKEVVE